MDTFGAALTVVMDLSERHPIINAEINNGSKDYDPEFIRNHIEKLTL